MKLPYEEAVREYEIRKSTRLGILVANRELPVLRRAKEIIDKEIFTYIDKMGAEFGISNAKNGAKYRDNRLKNGAE